MVWGGKERERKWEEGKGGGQTLVNAYSRGFAKGAKCMERLFFYFEVGGFV